MPQTTRFGAFAGGRRLLSGLFAALLLATQVFSSAFLAAEADHDCLGSDCPVCQELQTCASNFQLLGSTTADGDILPPTVVPVAEPPVASAFAAPATTLLSLDVRFDE